MGLVDGHIKKAPAVQAGQTREARFASVNAGGGERGAGSQSRCNRLLPDLGFRDRSRHKGVHCVRAKALTDLPTLRWPLLNRHT